MENIKIDFENFLKDVHASGYTGLDDEMSDDYEKWLSELEADDFIRLANDWAKTL